MSTIQRLYGHSLALLTDLYQLTMAQGYWKVGAEEQQSVFHLFFRRAPFKGGYAVACGIETAAEFLAEYAFDSEDLEYLSELVGNDGNPLFEKAFLDFLENLEFSCDIDSVSEGDIVFAHEPLLRVRGPLLQCQLIETALLNIVNFQTLIATKASRICRAAHGEPVLEFGLRRSHSIDGGLSASRAAYVGGCAATSNVLAGKLFNIPIKGTHAHSWVMSFEDEMESFRSYARAMPNNCVFLVDTYDTLEGVKKAVEVGKWLRVRGHEMVGIRLDSGNLAQLSIDARKILDDSGFNDAAIVASNDLDEHSITKLKQKGSTIAVWGIGTKLATAFDEPALGGVYKLSAIRKQQTDPWQYKIKLSEQIEKSSNPGIQQIRRFQDKETKKLISDVIFDEKLGISDSPIFSELSSQEERTIEADRVLFRDMLTPLFRSGERKGIPRPLDIARREALSQLDLLGPEWKEFTVQSHYPVGLEQKLSEVKKSLINELRNTEDRGNHE